MGAITRATLRQRLAVALKDRVTGTATGGDTSTLVDTSRIEPDSRWMHFYLEIVTTTDGLAPQDELRLVTGHDQATGTLVVSPEFSVAPATGDTYALWPLQPAEFDWAIDEGVMAAWPGWFKEVVDETTLDTAANTRVYALPADAEVLLRAWVGVSTAVPRARTPPWRVEGQAGHLSLVFEAQPSYPYDIGVRYLARPSLAAGADAELDVGFTGVSTGDEEACAAFIRAYAIAEFLNRQYQQQGREQDLIAARTWSAHRREARLQPMRWPSGTLQTYLHGDRGARTAIGRLRRLL
jgi:hypothetical protein